MKAKFYTDKDKARDLSNPQIIDFTIKGSLARLPEELQEEGREMLKRRVLWCLDRASKLTEAAEDSIYSDDSSKASQYLAIEENLDREFKTYQALKLELEGTEPDRADFEETVEAYTNLMGAAFNE